MRPRIGESAAQQLFLTRASRSSPGNTPMRYVSSTPELLKRNRRHSDVMKKRTGASVIFAVALVAVAGACSTESSNHSSPTTTTRVATLRTSPPTTTAPQFGLRGIRVRTADCNRSAAPGKQVPPPLRLPVQRFVVCPFATERFALTPKLVRVGQPAFRGLASALAESSEPTTNQACPLYEEAPREVFAVTSNGVYWVRIPTDGCGHYLPDATAAILHA